MTTLGKAFLALVLALGGGACGRSSSSPGEQAHDAAGTDSRSADDVSGGGSGGADDAATDGRSSGSGGGGQGGIASAGTGGLGTGGAGATAGAGVDAGAADAFGSGVRLCSGQAPVTAGCRIATDCGPIGPVVCSVSHYDWGSAACPLGPQSQPCPNECTTDANCAARAGGKCAPYTRPCPLCNGRVCTYPPPPCTSSPSSCDAGLRCRSDGTCEIIPCNEGGPACGTSYRCSPTSTKADKRGCEPLPCDSGFACAPGTRCNVGSTHSDPFGCELTPCTDGYACLADTRCKVGSPRADQHGCEYTPCNDGFSCPTNTRCTVMAPTASDHGCTTVTCTTDADCDCGYCVTGACSAVPGTCQYPPQ